jgi:NADPH:quinone reductase-like Zn-dependent oxidoreductase
MMKAIRYYRYGPPDVLKLEDTGVPAVGDQDVLIRVMAASVNPLDWHFMRGDPIYPPRRSRAATAQGQRARC